MADLTYRKVDLHIHTPGSLCYSDDGVSLEKIVNSALNADLDAIAVTDHNTFEAIDAIRKAVEKKDLFVFPGVELSTRGGHFLAVFELDTPVTRLEGFLDYIGIERERWGDAGKVIENRTEEVLEKIEEWGGIAIAAHIERWPSGFLETVKSRRAKMAIHASPYLSALEITIPEHRDLWCNGQVRDYPKRYACIQGSDAHSPEEIGRRPVYIKMNDVNLESLRIVFNETGSGIIFPDEYDAG